MPRSKDSYTQTPLMLRLVPKVLITRTHWLWTGALDRGGYARIKEGPGRLGGTLYVHRALYERFVGPVPEGMELDHLCRVRHCVNPSHLESVNHQTNVDRGLSAKRTHCPQGHPHNEENTHITKAGVQHCRRCDRERKLEKRRQRQNG